MIVISLDSRKTHLPDNHVREFLLDHGSVLTMLKDGTHLEQTAEDAAKRAVTLLSRAHVDAEGRAY